MYSVEITRNAKRDLKKLESNLRERILKKVYKIRLNPFKHVKRLQGKKLWRLRVEDHRVILDIIISGKKIIVLRIGHRKNIYDKI